jgi:uncharacterized membrane protein YphA (DoxX/SURF4 family)
VVLGITAGTQGSFYLFGTGNPPPASILVGVLLMVSGAALLAGCLTPVAGALTAFIAGSMAASLLPLPTPNLMDSRLTAILAACVAAALIFLGPGALSLDARLFGRREIIIPPASRSNDS